MADSKTPAASKTTKTAASKTTASAKPAAAKPAAVKPAIKAAAKPAASKTAKPAAAKTTTVRRAKAKSVSPEQRYMMIAEAAYFRAEKRGFSGIDAWHDWYEAEREIDGMLASGKTPI